MWQVVAGCGIDYYRSLTSAKNLAVHARACNAQREDAGVCTYHCFITSKMQDSLDVVFLRTDETLTSCCVQYSTVLSIRDAAEPRDTSAVSYKHTLLSLPLRALMGERHEEDDTVGSFSPSCKQAASHVLFAHVYVYSDQGTIMFRRTPQHIVTRLTLILGAVIHDNKII